VYHTSSVGSERAQGSGWPERHGGIQRCGGPQQAQALSVGHAEPLSVSQCSSQYVGESHTEPDSTPDGEPHTQPHRECHAARVQQGVQRKPDSRRVQREPKLGHIVRRRQASVVQRTPAGIGRHPEPVGLDVSHSLAHGQR
jgi:hypothetical protein